MKPKPRSEQEEAKGVDLVKAVIRDWLYFIENSSVSFDKGCNGEPDESELCRECQLTGCIKRKIMNSNTALAAFHMEQTCQKITITVRGKSKSAMDNANARLIAASPDLLGACRVALGALNDIRTGRYPSAGVLARTELERAILKATNQER